MDNESSPNYGFIALTFVITQMGVVWGSLAVVYELGMWGRAPAWLGYPFGLAYLFCLAGLIFAAASLVRGVGECTRP